jgi:hypothetical protein
MSAYPTIRPSESHTYLNSLIRAAVMDAVKSNAVARPKMHEEEISLIVPHTELREARP